jgi:hypothetical protein
MECKCLFLRTRTPSKDVLQFIVEGIWPNFKFNTSQSANALSKAHSNFDSWRNTLNRELKKTANSMIDQQKQVLFHN